MFIITVDSVLLLLCIFGISMNNDESYQLITVTKNAQPVLRAALQRWISTPNLSNSQLTLLEKNII